MRSGPLDGLRVVEMSAIGPVPFACRLMADLGAEVVRLERDDDRARVDGAGQHDLYAGRPAIALDLKSPADVAQARQLIASAEVVMEGFRPGVMERLGLGPDLLLADNPALVYVRMTGWGQDGPLAGRAGHDINYLALTGGLHSIGEPGRKPVVPINLVGDFGGGAMFAVMGALAGVLAARGGAPGQVVDAAMVDGATYLLSMTYAMLGAGRWVDDRSSNLFDGGAPFYDTYLCADGRWIAVGALEPQFWAAFVDRLGIPDLPSRNDPTQWPVLRARLTAAFASRPRDEWADHFAGTDACVSPVLSLTEASQHAAMTERRVFRTVDGHPRPAPAPRFAATPAVAAPYSLTEILDRWGVERHLAGELSACESTR
ncbi:MAG TPA: CaiB/BaiF CoA-transferase family protein [Mycobacteriales bacterium]|nr:CaiB/BaiF CoA-transferase family protein [Mycobacteriales bacterium]